MSASLDWLCFHLPTERLPRRYQGGLRTAAALAGTPGAELAVVNIAVVIGAVGFQSFLLFHGYALLFTATPVVRRYARLRRWFEGAFAFAFGAASLKVLTAKLAG